jgi:hypothetical protein
MPRFARHYANGNFAYRRYSHITNRRALHVAYRIQIVIIGSAVREHRVPHHELVGPPNDYAQMGAVRDQLVSARLLIVRHSECTAA